MLGGASPAVAAALLEKEERARELQRVSGALQALDRERLALRRDVRNVRIRVQSLWAAHKAAVASSARYPRGPDKPEVEAMRARVREARRELRQVRRVLQQLVLSSRVDWASEPALKAAVMQAEEEHDDHEELEAKDGEGNGGADSG